MAAARSQFLSITASMRPIVLVGRLFGLAPNHAGCIPFRVASVYTLFVAFVVAAGCCLSVKQSFKDYSEGKATLQSIITDSILMVFAGISSVTILVLSVTKASDKKLLYEKLEKIDAGLFKTMGVEPNQNFRKSLIFEILCTLLVLIGWFLGVWINIGSLINGIKLSFQFLLTCIAFITLIEFLNSVQVLRVRYLTLNSAILSIFYLQKSLFFDEMPRANKIQTISQNQTNTKTLLKSLRLIHNQLYPTSKLINEIFGLKILGIFSCILADLIYTVYVLIQEVVEEPADYSEFYASLALDACWVAICLLVLILTSFSCHWAVVEADNTLLVLQQCLLLTSLSVDLEEALEKFARQAERSKPVFSAFGLFDLNKTVVLSVTSTVCTYMIVLTTANI